MLIITNGLKRERHLFLPNNMHTLYTMVIILEVLVLPLDAKFHFHLLTPFFCNFIFIFLVIFLCRKEYKQLDKLRGFLLNVPFIGLTATATQKYVQSCSVLENFNW